MRQATLDIAAPYPQTLDNFVVGANAEALAAVTPPWSGFHGVWLCGAQGVGKTHLLRGASTAMAGGAQAVFIDGQHLGSARAQLELALESGALIAIDNIEGLLCDAVFAALVMSVYQRLLQSGGALLIAHRQPATSVDGVLPDLDSRLRGLPHYALAALNDEQKGELLRRRALHLGYELSDTVLHYWLTHGPRDLAALLTDLGRLDRASLAERRQVTVPLLKAELGY